MVELLLDLYVGIKRGVIRSKSRGNSFSRLNPKLMAYSHILMDPHWTAATSGICGSIHSSSAHA